MTVLIVIVILNYSVAALFNFYLLFQGGVFKVLIFFPLSICAVYGPNTAYAYVEI